MRWGTERNRAQNAHNHPSGELTPSQEDKNITDRLIQVGRILHIEVVDHLIISPETFTSFVGEGVFEELKNSPQWMPPYELIEKIREEEQKIKRAAVKSAEEKGDKKVLEMAKEMKQKGIEISIISELSKLSKEEIENL